MPKDIVRKKVTFYVNEDVYENAKESARNLGISFSGYLNMCLHERFKQDSVVDMAVCFKTIESQLHDLGLMMNKNIENKTE